MSGLSILAVRWQIIITVRFYKSVKYKHMPVSIFPACTQRSRNWIFFLAIFCPYRGGRGSAPVNDFVGRAPRHPQYT